MLVGTEDALIFRDDADWESAQHNLIAAGFGDGLPLVVPTEARLQRMLAKTEDRTQSLGLLPPLFGDLTIEAIAYCCVLAGCLPDELPVVATAIIATLEADFNLLGIQTTTGTPTVCTVVHGSAVQTLQMNSGTNCLGPGNRANACIGRAIQLVLTTIGGAKPGIADVATMGQPGKYAFCFAEGEHRLIPSLAVLRGLAPDQSAVTVIGVSGTLEVLPRSPADTAELAVIAMRDAMHGARMAYGGGRARECEEQFILIPPEIADLIDKRGWSLERIQEHIWQHSPNSPNDAPWPLARAPQDVNCILTGGAGVKMTCLVPWGGGTRSVTRPILSGI